MPVVHPCTRPGCATLTIGAFCLEHNEFTTKQSVHRPTEQRRRRRAGSAWTVAAIAFVLSARFLWHLPSRAQPI